MKMSDLLTAARQALEFLSHAVAEDWPDQKRKDAVCDALRQAIEQAEQQKPVAWMYREPNNKYGLMHIDEYDYAQMPKKDEWFPLYRSPTQRTPLTDEEVVALFNRLCQERSAWPERRYRDFARWVERAHGIGGGE
jgi:hypothetical protein